MATATASPVAATSFGIKRGEVYSLPAFRKITGLGRAALRTARRQGLRVAYQGNRGFVSGDAFCDFIEGVSPESR